MKNNKKIDPYKILKKHESVNIVTMEAKVDNVSWDP